MHNDSYISYLEIKENLSTQQETDFQKNCIGLNLYSEKKKVKINELTIFKKKNNSKLNPKKQKERNDRDKSRN